MKNTMHAFTFPVIKNIIVVEIRNSMWRLIMRISGITYVKRKRRWFSKLLSALLVIIVIALVVVLLLLMFTNVHIPYISEWLES